MPISRIKNFFATFNKAFEPRPLENRVIHLGGAKLKYRRYVKYKTIMIVDDIPRYADEVLKVLAEHFAAAELTVHIVHGYNAARAVFEANDIKLVILDHELEDEAGNGATLLQHFLHKKPDLVVLANSGKKNHNESLLRQGAVWALNKDPELLRQWLKKNCEY